MRIIQSVLLFILLTALVSCAQTAKTGVDNSAAAQPKKDAASVPVNLKNSDSDSAIGDESALVVTLPNNNEILFGRDAKPLAKSALAERLKESGRDLKPDRRYVYIKADPAVEFRVLREVLDQIRRAAFDRVRLAVSRDDKPEANAMFELKIPAEPKENELIKPNPNYLRVKIENDGKLKLNVEEQTLDSLKTLLRQIFKDREARGVLREGSNETEQTVHVEPAPNVKYGELVKTIDALREAGAAPLVFKIDDDQIINL